MESTADRIGGDGMTKAILRPIIPRTPLYKEATFQKELKKALHDVGTAMKKTFEGTTETWETDVKFTMRSKVTGFEASISVSTDNKIYGYVNEGTEPHIIRPKRAMRLAFQTGYRAKTRPRSIVSGPGGSFGETAFAKVVHHPGTKAREFTKYVSVRYQDILPRAIQDAINRAAKEG